WGEVSLLSSRGRECLHRSTIDTFLVNLVARKFHNCSGALRAPNRPRARSGKIFLPQAVAANAYLEKTRLRFGCWIRFLSAKSCQFLTHLPNSGILFAFSAQPSHHLQQEFPVRHCNSL